VPVVASVELVAPVAVPVVAEVVMAGGTHLCCAISQVSPPQHSLALMHHCPSGTHPQCPPLQLLPPQQSVFAVHAALSGKQQ
jgi:hypothetical protein